MKQGQAGIPEDIVRWVLILGVLIAIIVFIASIVDAIDLSFIKNLGGI